MEDDQSDHLPPHLLLRVKIFIRDLLAFESDDEARRRLGDPTAEFYFSTVYFSPEEARMLLQSRRHQPGGGHRQQLGGGGGGGHQQEQQGSVITLRKTLQEWFLHKWERGEYRVCTSHDLAPIVQDWFDVCKGFRDQPGFKKELKLFTKSWQRKQGRHVPLIMRRTTHPLSLPRDSPCGM